MKLRPVSNRAGELYGYAHWCPGCKHAHVFHTVKASDSAPVWSFNGDLERPTFSPSMRQFVHAHGGVPEQTLCHYFLKDGELEFLSDSSDHELRGKVPLPEFPEGYSL